MTEKLEDILDDIDEIEELLQISAPIILVDRQEMVLTDKEGNIYNLCPEPLLMQ